MAKNRAPSLRRRAPRREPKKRFTIFCEGANTEPAYFGALRSIVADALIEINTENAVGVPETIVRKAQDFLHSLRGQTDLFELGDEVWVAFDRDDHQKFQELVNVCEQKGIGVARSNPCFELWLILHIQDFDKPDDRKKLMAFLRTLRPEYDPRGSKKLDFDALLAFLTEAERRAEAQLTRREDEGMPFGRPSTTVGRLTRAIREAAARASP